MTSKTASLGRKANKPTLSATVLFFVYPGIKLLDLSGPLQVFSDARDETSGNTLYTPRVVSLRGGEMETDTGLIVKTERAPRVALQRPFTLIVVGGDGSRRAAKDPSIVRCVSELAGQADRVASVCTGAFVLAAAGVLRGRRVVTHWQSCDELATAHPELTIDVDPIYLQDGRVWTSAGVTAGIDMALALVSEECGKQVALSLARSLVSYVVRPGGQSQFSVALNQQLSDAAGRFSALHEFMRRNLERNLSVDVLAEQVTMSPRHFARRYTAETGTTPAKAVEAMRVEAAQQCLAESNDSLARIARRCGFGDVDRMRRAFVRRLNVSPLAYRRRFATAGG